MITHWAKRSFEKMKNIFFVSASATHNKQRGACVTIAFLKMILCASKQTFTFTKQSMNLCKRNEDARLKELKLWPYSVTTCKEGMCF